MLNMPDDGTIGLMDFVYMAKMVSVTASNSRGLSETIECLPAFSSSLAKKGVGELMQTRLRSLRMYSS